MSAAAADVLPSVIVGKGRIGSALADMGDGKDTLVGRADSIPDGTGPIYVCTRNDDLADVVSRTPESRRQDLVFLQNGILAPFLEEQGLSKNTQALIYFAVAKAGAAPIDGVTDVNPEGLTAACGPWADEFKKRLAKGGLTCAVLDPAQFAARAYEKHIWICAFMLVGVKHSITVGEVESQHKSEVIDLINELMAASSSKYGIKFEDGVQERLCAYARSVAHYPTAVKEFNHRNGFFFADSKAALQSGQTDPTPLHTAMLQEAGIVQQDDLS